MDDTAVADVVLVDPHQLIRAGLSLILQAQPDFRIVGEADCGEDAVALVHQRRPDVVCVAARMEVTDGFEVTRRIRSLDDLEQPSIVLLVGSKDGDVSQLAQEAGADAVVAKYATPESIVMAMRAALMAA